MNQLTVFRQVVALHMLPHLFSSYGKIGKINLKENAVKMMGPYYPAEPLACLIDQLKKGQGFSRELGQKISDAMMVLKGITFLAQTDILNKDIWGCRQQSTKLNTWKSFKKFFHRLHILKRRAVTTTGKGMYTMAV